MDNFALKVFAFIGCLIGNCALLFVDGDKNPTLYFVLRGLGYMAIPIVSFLVVEGVYHTKNVKKYIGRLFGFALLAEAPQFNIWRQVTVKIAKMAARYGGDEKLTLNELMKKMDDESVAYLKDGISFLRGSLVNGLFTVALAAIMVLLIKKINEKFAAVNKFACYMLVMLVAIGMVIVSAILFAQNSVEILLFAAMYCYLRGNRTAISIMTVLMMFTVTMTANYMAMTGIVVGTLLIFSYNGRPGKTATNMKYIFYIAYPAQLLALYMISAYLVK